MKNITSLYSLGIIFLLASLELVAQPKDTLNVGVLVYDEVELLDFAGPAEVFAAASYYTDLYYFNVYTVAKKSLAKSQGFLDITPNYSIQNAPASDILVLPGGGANRVIEDAPTMDWVKKNHKDALHTLTVCSGVYILNKLGALEGLRVTAHHKSLPHLKTILGEEYVAEDVKFVDNGKVITAAGVSSGIEGALWLVAKIAGYEASHRLARYLEYPYWKMDNGNIAFDLQNTAAILMKDSNVIPHFGLLDVLGHRALSRGDTASARQYFKTNQSLYPGNVLTYHSLALVLGSGKEWVPLTYENFLMYAEKEGIQAGKSMYEKAKKHYPGWKIFSAQDMYMYGKRMVWAERYEEGITALEMGIEAYPKVPRLYLELSSLYEKSGKTKAAIEVLRTAKALFPSHEAISSQVKSLTN